MDTNTGIIYELKPGETIESLEKRLNVKPGQIVPLDNMPIPKCRECGGKGYKRAGLCSKRFKPCKCCKK